MGMSLSDAIKHCEGVATDNESMCEYNLACSDNQRSEWKKCAKEHRQLAEWLRELKGYRIAHYKLRDMDYEYDFNSIFGKNPMYYGEKIWDLFGDIDASVEYEVMGYEEVNADENNND